VKVSPGWLTSETHVVPGLPAPVFTPSYPGGQFTITSDHQLARYDGFFPKTFIDHGQWVQEPWSGRVVAVTHGGGLSVLRPGARQFERFAGAIPVRQAPLAATSRPLALLPRQRLTLIIDGGRPYSLGENALTPWISDAEFAEQGVSGVSALYDAAGFGAVILVDGKRSVHIRSDDGSWRHLTTLSRNDYGLSLIDIPGRDAALFQTAKSALLIHRVRSGNESRFTVESLPILEGAPWSYESLPQMQQVVTYNRGGLFDSRQRWRRLDADGLVDIPGGDIGPGLIREIGKTGSALISTLNGAYFYDGAAIRPVFGHPETAAGHNPVFYLPTLNRVVAITRTGLLDVSPGTTHQPVSVPFATESAYSPVLVDWPAAGLALALTEHGVYSLDRDLHVEPVAGGDRFKGAWLGSVSVFNPSNGDSILMGGNGIFAAIIDRDGKTCAKAGD
jgi:hypothetical protein